MPLDTLVRSLEPLVDPDLIRAIAPSSCCGNGYDFGYFQPEALTYMTADSVLERAPLERLAGQDQPGARRPQPARPARRRRAPASRSAARALSASNTRPRPTPHPLMEKDGNPDRRGPDHGAEGGPDRGEDPDEHGEPLEQDDAPQRPSAVQAVRPEVRQPLVQLGLAAVTAKGAHRWQHGHPWIYRTDVVDVSATPGEIVEVNPRLDAEPSLVNSDPYGDGWLIRIVFGDPSEADALLDVAAYKQVVAES